MSALGQKQTSAQVGAMSALPPKRTSELARIEFDLVAPAAWRYSLQSVASSQTPDPGIKHNMGEVVLPPHASSPGF